MHMLVCTQTMHERCVHEFLAFRCSYICCISNAADGIIEFLQTLIRFAFHRKHFCLSLRIPCTLPEACFKVLSESSVRPMWGPGRHQRLSHHSHSQSHCFFVIRPFVIPDAGFKLLYETWPVMAVK